ncbi:outer membrane receptor protein involved in Fe transport [Hymenobacter sp. 1B]|uniref:Outer membrane receptor protein involved in Fe transport n=2 Tax=Hymenobacter artigasi TaxID=2719616 RepID=A0ABX1HIG1_9BACT|nr:TonB-dependent receptor [Hymenobacter artigasi]NKI89990.1 outer membrane receptor protein involved in Fe transport [Hymenobacter artigasi]
MKTATLRALGAFLAALLLARPAAAQTPAAAATPAVAATGSLTGTVLDSLKKEPVPYATVVLLPPAPNDKPITGVAADDAGKFSLTKLAPGPFRLRVSYVGYGTQTRAVTITAGATDAGTFRLPVAGTALAEAVIIGQKPVVEIRPDRIVYNADQDATNAGGTAADVLRKAPLLAVDGDGNVKMRGSSNFKVLVNNKPSPTLASNLAEALKGIPAEQIQSVEIITTPPAKYDGEGTAGIINIVLKKGVEQGLNGRIGASGGSRNSGVNGSLNFKTKKLGFTSSGGTGGWYGPNRSERTRFGKTDNSTLTQQGVGNYSGQWMYGSVGLDYDLSEHQSLSLAASVNRYAGHDYNNMLNDFVSPARPQDNQLFTRATNSKFSGLNGELTGTYTKTFALPRKEWSVLGQYANNSGTFGYDFDQYLNSTTNLEVGRANYRERSRGRTPGSEVTLQTDLVQPFGDKQTLETGLKAIFRNTGSVANVDGLTRGVTEDFVRLPGRSTDFSYAQNVQAGYATYTNKLSKKLSVSLGSRLERTALSADFRTNDTSFVRSYLSLLPNGNAQYAFSDNNSVRAAYSRRITRPYIDYLNPFVDRSDPKNLVYGNPALSPELTDSYELSFNTNGKAGSLNIAASMRRTGNAIESIRLGPDASGVTRQTFANVASNAFYQLNFYGSAKPAKGWDISGGPDVQYIVRRSPTLGIERRGFTAGLNLNSSYKLPKNFMLQGYVYASLPSPDLQGQGAANLYYQMGVKKTFLKDKADVVLNIAAPFNDYWLYRNTTDTPTFSETNRNYSYQRSFRLSFNYRFGQAQQGKQRKSISNDDVKGGGGSKQGGQ